MQSSTPRAERPGTGRHASQAVGAAPSTDCLAFATAKSFGDFVIAHSVLHRVEESARDRLRLISNRHVKALNAILPDNVRVTLVDSDADRVPALFDIKKRGAVAGVRSAWSLRREIRRIERRHNEMLAFAAYGVRERFIAGGWKVIHPRMKGRNIYETYFQLLAEQCFPVLPGPPPLPNGGLYSVGIFPESRLTHKRLPAATLSTIFERSAAANLEATLYILKGDMPPERDYPRVAHIPRDFVSLRTAINSVDCVVSADSLPAHLAEYFGRPAFVALPAPNEYWMPLGCFNDRRWGEFSVPGRFADALTRFFSDLRT